MCTMCTSNEDEWQAVLYCDPARTFAFWIWDMAERLWLGSHVEQDVMSWMRGIKPCTSQIKSMNKAAQSLTFLVS